MMNEISATLIDDEHESCLQISDPEFDNEDARSNSQMDCNNGVISDLKTEISGLNREISALKQERDAYKEEWEFANMRNTKLIEDNVRISAQLDNLKNESMTSEKNSDDSNKISCGPDDKKHNEVDTLRMELRTSKEMYDTLKTSWDLYSANANEKENQYEIKIVQLNEIISDLQKRVSNFNVYNNEEFSDSTNQVETNSVPSVPVRKTLLPTKRPYVSASNENVRREFFPVAPIPSYHSMFGTESTRGPRGNFRKEPYSWREIDAEYGIPKRGKGRGRARRGQKR